MIFFFFSLVDGLKVVFSLIFFAYFDFVLRPLKLFESTNQLSTKITSDIIIKLVLSVSSPWLKNLFEMKKNFFVCLFFRRAKKNNTRKWGRAQMTDGGVLRFELFQTEFAGFLEIMMFWKFLFWQFAIFEHILQARGLSIGFLNKVISPVAIDCWDWRKEFVGKWREIQIYMILWS